MTLALTAGQTLQTSHRVLPRISQDRLADMIGVTRSREHLQEHVGVQEGRLHRIQRRPQGPSSLPDHHRAPLIVTAFVASDGTKKWCSSLSFSLNGRGCWGFAGAPATPICRCVYPELRDLLRTRESCMLLVCSSGVGDW